MPQRTHYPCPSCRQSLSSPRRDIGQTDTCPTCGRCFAIPNGVPGPSIGKIVGISCSAVVGVCLLGLIVTSVASDMQERAAERRAKEAAGWTAYPGPDGGTIWMPPLDTSAIMQGITPAEPAWELEAPITPHFDSDYAPSPSSDTPGSDAIRRGLEEHYLDPLYNSPARHETDRDMEELAREMIERFRSNGQQDDQGR